MSESMQHNMETHVGDNSDYGHGSGDQVLCDGPPNLSRNPLFPSKLANNVGNPNY